MLSERFAFKIIVQIKLEGFLLPPSWSKKSLLMSVTRGFAVVRSDFFAVWIDYHGWFVAVIWTDVNDALDNEENVRRKLVCRPKLIIFLDDFGTQSIRALEKNHMERREKGQLCGVNRNQSSLSSCANAGCCWPAAARSSWIFKWDYVATTSLHLKDFIMLA